MSGAWIVLPMIGMFAMGFAVGGLDAKIDAAKARNQNNQIVAIPPDANGVACYWYEGQLSCMKVTP